MKTKKFNKNPVFIRIEEPLSAKKEILESAILLAKISRHYEKINLIRTEKTRYNAKLTSITKDLNELLKNLHNLLPIVKGQRVKKEFEEPIQPIEPLQESSLSEIDKLEQELNDVNKKLSSLDF